MKSHPTTARSLVFTIGYLASTWCALGAALAPCGGTTVSASPFVQLTWEEVPGARSYGAEISTNSNFLTGVQYFGGSSTGGQATTLQNGTAYWWRVRSNSAQSWEPPVYTYSNICSFSTSTVTQVPQFAPSQFDPQNNGSGVGLGVTVRWTYLGGSDGYEVQLSTNSNMSGAISSGLISTAEFFFTPLAVGTTYYWRVRAHNSIGYGAWTLSPIWRFDTESAVTPIVVKALLQGPLSTTPSVSMNDGLRSGGHIPANEPYSLGSTYYFLVNGWSSVTPAQLAVTGTTAIVDWVVFMARHGTTNAPLRGWVMLLRRDGSMVMPDGSAFNYSFPMKNVKFSIHHRNHLGAMTANAVNAVGTSLTVDFTATSTVLHGTNPTYLIAGKQALWAGDCNGDGVVKYSGSNNDRDRVLQAIGGVIPTSFVDGYLPEDVSMNGRVLYSGGGNDRDLVLSVIGGVIPTATRTQQIP